MLFRKLTKKALQNIQGGFARGFSTISFEGVSTQDSYMRQISNSHSVQEISDVIERKGSFMRTDQIVNTLRSLARLTDFRGRKDTINLLRKDEFKDILKKVEEDLEFLNENEILDLSFFIRKYAQVGIIRIFSFEFRGKLMRKIRNMVDNERLDVNKLSNMYFDLTLSKYNTDLIARALFRIFQKSENADEYDPINIMQILVGGSNLDKSSYAQKILSDIVCRKYKGFLTEMNYVQKCSLFKAISKCELHYSAPKYMLPPILYEMRTDIKNNLDRLGERGVLDILEGYVYLPKEFPNDLLEEINMMIMLTLQHNAANIKTDFLFSYLEIQNRIPRIKRIQEERMTIILSHLAERVPEDQYLQRGLGRLIRTIFNMRYYSQDLNEAIMDFMAEENIHKPVAILEYLAIQGLDPSFIIQNNYDEGLLDHENYIVLRRLKSVLVKVNEEDNIDLIENIRNLENYNVTENLYNFNYTTYLGKQNEEEILYFIEKWGDLIEAEDLRSLNHKCFVTMLNLVKTSKTKTRIIEILDEKFENGLPSNKLNFLMSIFTKSDKTTFQNALLLQILEKNTENLHAYAFVDFLLSNTVHILDLIMSREHFLTRYFMILNRIENWEETVRLDYFFNLIFKLDRNSFLNDLLLSMTQKLYAASLKKEFNMNLSVQLRIAQLLIKKGRFNIQEAERIYGIIADYQYVNPMTKINIFTYVLRNSENVPEELENRARQRIEELNTELDQVDARKAFNALTFLMLFPSQYTQDKQELYLQSLKDHISFVYPRQFVDLLSIINIMAPEIRNNFPYYFPFLREIGENYPNFNRRMKFEDICNVFDTFTLLGVKSPTLYNTILSDIGRSFHLFRSHDIFKIVRGFSRMKMKQADLFDKIVMKIIQNRYAYHSKLHMMVFYFFNLGYDSSLIKTKFESLFSNRSMNHTTVLKCITYLTILDHPQEQSILNNLTSRVKNSRISARSKVNEELTYLYLKGKYPEEEYAEIFKGCFEELNLTGIYGGINFDHIAPYLEAMKIEFEERKEINGITVPCFIPETNTIVYFMKGGDINFDKFSLRGKGLLTQKVYNETFGEEYNIVEVNISDFFMCSDNVSKVNYLTAQGIEDKNEEKEYNFGMLSDKDNSTDQVLIFDHALEEEDNDDDDLDIVFLEDELDLDDDEIDDVELN